MIPCSSILTCWFTPMPEPATDRDCSLSTTSVNHRGPPSMSRRVGYPWTEQMSRKLSRKVRETRSSSSQKRSEPAAHPCRGPGGQGGNEHGGVPWFSSREGSSRAGPPQGRGVSRWGASSLRCRTAQRLLAQCDRAAPIPGTSPGWDRHARRHGSGGSTR